MSTNGFGKKIATYQDELLANKDTFTDDIGDVRKRLFSAQSDAVPKRPNWVPLVGFGVAAAAACALLVIFLLGEQEPSAPATTPVADSLQGQWLYASGSDKTVTFTDKSEVILEKGSTARILSEEGHDVHFLLEQGLARVNVIHHDDTNWVMDVGPYKVNVVGTTFTLSWIPQTQIFSLTLDEGAVEVFGPMVEGGRRISRKETFTASVVNGTVEIQSAEPVKLALDTEDSAADSRLDGSSLSHSIETVSKGSKGRSKAKPGGKNSKEIALRSVPSKRKTSSWQKMNREGKFSDVVADARSQGIAAVLDSKPAPELMALGDAARLVREWRLAHNAYIALRNRAPGSKNASIAAFSIGKIAFDNQKNYGVASQWLETYLREDPTGRLSREALGRLMEARQKLGNHSGAKSAAQQYLQKYPNGPHADVASGILK